MTVVAGYIRMLLKERAGPFRTSSGGCSRKPKSLRPAVGAARRAERPLGTRGGHGHLQPGVGRPRALLSEAIAAPAGLPDRDVSRGSRHGERTSDARREMPRACGSRCRHVIADRLRRELVTSDRLWGSSNGCVRSARIGLPGSPSPIPIRWRRCRSAAESSLADFRRMARRLRAQPGGRPAGHRSARRRRSGRLLRNEGRSGYRASRATDVRQAARRSLP